MLFFFVASRSLQHSDYVKDVFMLLNDPVTASTGGEKRRDILMFLRELFNMAKTLQVRILCMHVHYCCLSSPPPREYCVNYYYFAVVS